MNPKHLTLEGANRTLGGRGFKNDPKNWTLLYGCSRKVLPLLYNLFVFQKPIKNWTLFYVINLGGYIYILRFEITLNYELNFSIASARR